MGAYDFASLPHIGEALKRKEDYRFLTDQGQYTADVVMERQARAVFVEKRSEPFIQDVRRASDILSEKGL